MSKAVLISIQPKWCELIASGKKTVEVRKSRPKMETPFKCYIYCTKAPKGWVRLDKNVQLDTKIIGEFVCNMITSIVYTMDGLADVVDCNTACMKPSEFIVYGKGDTLYAWHISDLKIYDKPKELSEFNAICPYKKPDGTRKLVECPCDKYTWDYDEKTGKSFCTRRITNPPQSWCYVEERELNDRA